MMVWSVQIARSRRSVSAAAALALVLAMGAPARADPPARTPTAADVATAKKLFEDGLKLYAEGSYAQALALFQRAYDTAPRASILRNIAQCQRDLKDFVAAYAAYADLLAKYGATMTPADRAPVERALADLAALTGTITVRVAEPGAAVRIDDRDAGTTPLAAPVRVNVGSHHVTVTKDGFEPLARDVALRGNDDVAIDGVLARKSVTGHLMVTAVGAGDVHVFVDGKDVGPPPWQGDVDPGVHVVEARGASAAAASQRAEVSQAGRLEIALQVEPTVGRVQVDAHDADAVISIDGKSVGRGVWDGTLPVGRHEIEIGTGATIQRRPFLLRPGETVVEDMPGGAAAGDKPTYIGLYSSLELFGAFSPNDATNSLSQQCFAGATCTPGAPLGGGFDIRIGYEHGWIGAEGVVFASYDTSTGSAQFPTGTTSPPAPSTSEFGVARTEDFRFHRYGGGFALGGRVMNEHPNVRATLGAAFGLAVKGNVFTRSTTAAAPDNGMIPNQEVTSGVSVYTAPVFLVDGGVMIGPARGPRFYVGGLMIVELVGDPVVDPGRSPQGFGTGQLGRGPMQVASGTQLFLGPVIGIRFGE
jgi:hypothetical protein